jgi:hypothetical protein
MWNTLGGPVYLKNESAEAITLTISSADDYSLDPGEVLQVLPGQVVTGTAVGGAALLQIIAGIVPADESASKGGGSVVAGGGAAASASRSTWSVHDNDFTAVIASATTLTLGTFPTALGTPNDEDFCLVVVTDANGLQTAYVPTRNAMTLSGQVLTVAGAAFDGTDLGYDVWIWGPPKSYDLSLNGDYVRELSPLWARQQNVVVANVSNIADTTHYYPSAAGIDHSGYRYGIFEVNLDCGAGTVTATVEALAHASGSWKDVTQDLFNVASLVATAGAASDEWAIVVPFVAVGLRLKVVAATGATTGDVTSYFHGQY